MACQFNLPEVEEGGSPSRSSQEAKSPDLAIYTVEDDNATMVRVRQ